MQKFRVKLRWRDGMDTLIFHGQVAQQATVWNLTNVFEVAALYRDSAFVEPKLMLGYMMGGVTKNLALFSEGHYLVTAKGALRQATELAQRNVSPEDVWVLNAADPRRHPK